MGACVRARTRGRICVCVCVYVKGECEREREREKEKVSRTAAGAVVVGKKAGVGRYVRGRTAPVRMQNALLASCTALAPACMQVRHLRARSPPCCACARPTDSMQ